MMELLGSRPVLDILYLALVMLSHGTEPYGSQEEKE